MKDNIELIKILEVLPYWNLTDRLFLFLNKTDHTLTTTLKLQEKS